MQESNQPQDIFERRTLSDRVIEAVNNLLRFINVSWARSQNIVESSYLLGCKMVSEGRVNEAIRRFQITLWLDKNHLPTLYNLGCLYHHRRENAKAIELFTRVLRMDPRNDHALYMVTSIKPDLIKAELQPRTMPPLMAIDYFDMLAPSYEVEQTQKGYRLPAILHQLLHEVMPPHEGRSNLIDLGCGTGICGGQFRAEFANIVGVDFSNRMLDLAYQRFDARGIKIYSRVVHNDIRLFVQESKAEVADVVLCIGVFPYLGDLELTIGGAANLLKNDGYFACSFVENRNIPAFAMHPPTGYFAHNLDYVLALADKYSLAVVRTGEVKAYNNQAEQLCIFRRKPRIEAAHADSPSHG